VLNKNEALIIRVF